MKISELDILIQKLEEVTEQLKTLRDSNTVRLLESQPITRDSRVFDSTDTGIEDSI